MIEDVVAARKQLLASGYTGRRQVQLTLQAAVDRYYQLRLQQARLRAAGQSLEQAVELDRITVARVANGVGLRADALRAQAEVAARQQDQLEAVPVIDASTLVDVDGPP